MTEKQIAGTRVYGELAALNHFTPVNLDREKPYWTTITLDGPNGEPGRVTLTVPLLYDEIERVEVGDHVSITVEITRDEEG